MFFLQDGRALHYDYIFLSVLKQWQQHTASRAELVVTLDCVHTPDIHKLIQSIVPCFNTLQYNTRPMPPACTFTENYYGLFFAYCWTVKLNWNAQSLFLFVWCGEQSSSHRFHTKGADYTVLALMLLGYTYIYIYTLIYTHTPASPVIHTSRGAGLTCLYGYTKTLESLLCLTTASVTVTTDTAGSAPMWDMLVSFISLQVFQGVFLKCPIVLAQCRV